MILRRLLISAACVLSLVGRAEAQQATYSDHWLQGGITHEEPDNFSTPEYGVGTTDSSYDPYEEYQVELKMYDGDSLVERLWSSWHPTYASVLGTAYIIPDIIHTPIANCAEVDHFVKKLLQDVVERFARTFSETQLYRIENRYRLVGWDDDIEQYVWTRDECYAACQHSAFCTPFAGHEYLRGYGVLGAVPGTGTGVCRLTMRAQTLRPGCQGPTGFPIIGDNGCPD